jgi:hypothetical protein
MMKFHNLWTIRTPPGWSCLFAAPLNRPDDIVEVLSGVVDTDRYVSPINFPFVPIAEDGVHVLRKGMPLAQVFPFARDDERVEAVIRAECPGDAVERERVYRNTLAGDGWYRREPRSTR